MNVKSLQYQSVVFNTLEKINMSKKESYESYPKELKNRNKCYKNTSKLKARKINLI